MTILIPNKPSNFYFNFTFSSNTRLLINGVLSKPVHDLLIYHIVTGKYICGYDSNENKIFSYLLPHNIETIQLNKNHIIY